MPLAGGPRQSSEDQRMRRSGLGQVQSLGAPQRSSSWCLLRAGLTQNALPPSFPASLSLPTRSVCDSAMLLLSGDGLWGLNAEAGRDANWHSCHVVGTAVPRTHEASPGNPYNTLMKNYYIASYRWRNRGPERTRDLPTMKQLAGRAETHWQGDTRIREQQPGGRPRTWLSPAAAAQTEARHQEGLPAGWGADLEPGSSLHKFNCQIGPEIAGATPR